MLAFVILCILQVRALVDHVEVRGAWQRDGGGEGFHSALRATLGSLGGTVRVPGLRSPFYRVEVT